jgi:hypothetical protein
MGRVGRVQPDGVQAAISPCPVGASSSRRTRHDPPHPDRHRYRGTFTDVVAFDEEAGALVTTEAPSTPGNPADGLLTGIDKVLAVLEADGDEVGAVSHGTTVATNQLLEGKLDRLGFITTSGYEAMLECRSQFLTATATPISGSSRAVSCPAT